MAKEIEGICWLLDTKTLAAIYVSPAFDDLCGRALDRLDPIAYRSHIHPADAERFLLALQELEPTSHMKHEFRIISSRGAVKWVFADVSTRRNAVGDVMAAVSITVDTSARQNYEEVFRERDNSDIAKYGRDLICAHNLEGTLFSFNDRAAQILGYSRDEIRNTPMKHYIPTDAHVEFDSYLLRIRMTGIASGVMRVVTKNGERRIWEYYNTLRTQGFTEPVVCGVAHDVTDQKRTEEALRTSDKNFSKVFMSSPMAIAITTLDRGEFVDVNEVFERQTGFRRGEIIGKDVSMLDVLVDERQHSHILAEIKAGRRMRSHEVQFRDKLGRVQTKLYSAEPIEIGGTVCLFAVFEDITQGKITEQTLKQLESSYQSLFLSSPCGMYRIALDGSFLFVNNALVDLLGYDSIDELLSRNLEEDIYANEDERYHILDKMEPLNPLKSVEVHWRRKDGALILVRAHARGWVSNEWGQVVGLETMVEDITQQRILEERLRQMQKMDSLALLAGGIAHDFNNVLTAVLGYSQLALKKLNRISSDAQSSIVSTGREFGLRIVDKTKSQLQHIVDAAAHGQALTAQLLAFSRADSLPIYPLSLDEEIRNISEMIIRLIGEHIKVQLCLGCDSQAILGERGAFSQVILNLCVNARDAMPNGGRLTVRTFSANVKLACDEHVGVPYGRYVVLEVADTGCGMSKTLQGRIFEPFFTTKQTGDGTGLGLYTVYSIVRRCGGYIRLQSEAGRGSTFWIYLPIVDTSQLRSRSAPNCSDVDFRNGIVMVVEDDDRVREIVAGQLESFGFHVLCEANGLAAIRQYEQLNEDIEFLVTDVVMPGLNGLGLAKRLRDRQPNLKVLYMTGWAPDELLSSSVLSQSAELLRKPFDDRALNAAIEKLLCHSKPTARDAKLLAFTAEV